VKCAENDRDWSGPVMWQSVSRKMEDLDGQARDLWQYLWA